MGFWEKYWTCQIRTQHSSIPTQWTKGMATGRVCRQGLNRQGVPSTCWWELYEAGADGWMDGWMSGWAIRRAIPFTPYAKKSYGPPQNYGVPCGCAFTFAPHNLMHVGGKGRSDHHNVQKVCWGNSTRRRWLQRDFQDFPGFWRLACWFVGPSCVYVFTSLLLIASVWVCVYICAGFSCSACPQVLTVFTLSTFIYCNFDL